MIQFSALLPIRAPFQISAPPSNVFLLISAPIVISAPILISAPTLISAPYSHIITAPSEYVSNVVYLPLIADIRNNVLQKQWSSSEFLNCNVHVST